MKNINEGKDEQINDLQTRVSELEKSLSLAQKLIQEEKTRRVNSHDFIHKMGITLQEEMDNMKDYIITTINQNFNRCQSK
mgnify:CR=1 FL=1